MKMVAGAKLRRAQAHVEAGRPYAHYDVQNFERSCLHGQALRVSSASI